MPKISDLPSGIPTTADVLPLVQGNTTKKATFNDLPIAAAASAALALKADAANPTFTGTVTGVSKTAVGLGNVDNTSDANKPISTATQTALNLKPSRNLLHNGNFVINQRLVSGTVTLAAGAYGHDRWKAGAGGCTYTFAASGNSFVITVSAGSLMQVVEDKNVDGGVYTLSHQGTAQARIAINGAATSGAYAAAPLTTASATALQTVTVEFTTGTIDRVQLESGTLSTPFERRQIGLELVLCQRYYEKSFDTSTTLPGSSVSAILTAFLLHCPATRYAVVKRGVPSTISLISPQTGSGATIAEYNTASTYVADRVPTVAASGTSGFEITSTSLTVGNFVRFHWTASADL